MVITAITEPPNLFDGDNFQLLLDGTPIGKPQANSVFQLNAVDRGTHTVAMQIVNKEGEVLISSEPVTFFMHRARLMKNGQIRS